MKRYTRNLWTTFCPRKVSWELSFIDTSGKHPTSDWQNNKQLIRESLVLLKDHGITGIRLVIFPDEITDGKKYHFKPMHDLLDLCVQLQMQVDLCIGPFQYPHYPGIYFPKGFTKFIKPEQKFVDDKVDLRRFGREFLEKQLRLYGKDERIRGFYLGNEWPDKQAVSGKEKIRLEVSKKFMLEAIRLVKEKTGKPVFFNTSIDAARTWQIRWVYKEIIKVLGKQARLGFDLYPSQEKWTTRIFRWLFPYGRKVKSYGSLLPAKYRLFSELEAQPWGGGKAWSTYIEQAKEPGQSILTYATDFLPRIWLAYVVPSGIQEVNLWGSDFWLACHRSGIFWPLTQVMLFSKK